MSFYLRVCFFFMCGIFGAALVVEPFNVRIIILYIYEIHVQIVVPNLLLFAK